MKQLLALLALATAVCVTNAAAEGTFELRQGLSTTSPIYLEGSLATGNVNYDQHRVTFLRVDILDPANEVIDLYGQALSGSPDIQVWCPGRIPLVTPDAPYSVPTPDFTADFTASNGELTSFADVQDVQSIGTRPRPPQTYSLSGATASCGTAGVYTLRYSSAGIDGAGQPFFDIRVRNTATSTLESGRVWADKYAFSMTNSSGRVGAELYVVAGTDRGDDYLGIVWLLDLNDIAPFGFQLFANDRGIGPPQYNYQSIGGSASPQPQMNPQYPIYLNPPAKPVVTPGALGNIEAIETQCVAGGATDVIFRFDTAGALPFTVRLDEDQSGTFDLDEVIATGTSVDGTNTVVWDGTLPGGGAIPSGTPYQVELSLTTGEVHFPFYDVEDADPGPVITPYSVPSTSTTALYYWDDTDPSITSASGGGTTSGPNGTTSTHNWANGTNNYNDANMIDTWKYADVQSIQDVYQLPASCVAAPAIGLSKDAAITADNGDGSVELTLDFRIENMGNIDLQDVQISDDLATALPAPVSWSIAGVTTSANLTANAGFDGAGDTDLLDAASSTLPLGDVGLVSVVLNVDFNGATGPFTNTAIVTADDGTTPVSDDSHAGTDPDPDGSGTPEEDTPTPLPIAESDLAVAKSVDEANPLVGDTITWTVTVTNNGPVTETDAEVTDAVPAGFSVDSVTTTDGSWSAPTWTLPTLAPGQSESLVITGSFTIDGSFDNVAELTAATNPDPDSTPNNGVPSEDDQDSSTVVVAPVADLSVTKTDGSATYQPGASVTYDIVVANAGPSDVTGAGIDDLFPAGFTGVTWSCTGAGGATCPNASGAGDISETIDLPAGGSLTYTATGSTASGATGDLANTASVTVPAGVTDPDGSNNSATDADTAAVTADLGVTKTDGSATYTPGGTVVYTIEFSNAGPSDAIGATISDAFPAALSGVTWSCSGSGGAACPAASGSGDISETVDLPAGGVLTYTASAAVSSSATGNLVNTASVTAPSGTTDPVPGNNTATDTDTVSAEADLVVSKTVDNATPDVGDQVIFTVTVTNDGPSDATNVSVTDALPSGYSLDLANPSQGSYTAPTWNVGTLIDGASATLDITATVNATGDYTNSASANATEDDPDPSNNDASASTTPVAEADLAITKVVDDASPDVGSQVTFTITVTNNGPLDATGVEVLDALPGGYSLDSASTSQGGYAAPTWTVGTLANGASATLELVATVNADGPYENTAAVSGSQTDPDPSNNDDSASTTPVAQSDIAVTKVVDNTTPNVGDQVTFTITVTNNGPSDATNISVNDPLPAGYTLDSDNPSQGGYTAPIWSVGNLADGASATLDITATVNASGPYANTAAGTATENDPDPSNNDDTATTTPVAQADIAVSKTVDDATPNVGDQVTFTITVINNGPSDATNISVNDPLPAGYTLDSDNPSQGGYTAPIWSVGNLANGASATLDITATVEASGSYANTATGSANEQDPDPSNNDDTASTTPVAQADLAVTKVVDDATPNVGDQVTFTITVTNNGPSDATNVSVNDALPAGYTLDSVNPSQGSYTAPNWNVGSLANGALATLDITATVETSGSYANTASGTANENDPDPSNNDDTATTSPVDQADLAVTKDDGGATVIPGETVSYTITVTNNGPSTATSVTLDDPTPAGLVFVSADAPCSGGFPCSLGDLNDGASATVNVVFEVPADYSGANPISNTASVSSDTQELDEDDNQASDTTPVAFDGQNPVIGLAKAVESIGGTIDSTTVEFVLSVENLGNVPLNEVQITDDLVASFAPPVTYSVDGVVATGSLVANSAYDGDADINLLDSSASSLPVGAMEIVTLTVSLDLSQTGQRQFENTAFASGEGPIGQATEDDSDNGFVTDPDGDGDPTGPEEDTPTPIELGGYQPLPVPVLNPAGLLVLTLMMLALGAGFSLRTRG
jgi:uncharacterized repeat protein (TIGR01451 family)